MSTTTTWETGTNDYARRKGLAAGILAARDLRAGDMIRIRVRGEVVLSTLPIMSIIGDGRDVVLVVAGESHVISKDMRVAVF